MNVPKNNVEEKVFQIIVIKGQDRGQNSLHT